MESLNLKKKERKRTHFHVKAKFCSCKEQIRILRHLQAFFFFFPQYDLVQWRKVLGVININGDFFCYLPSNKTASHIFTQKA